MSGHVIWYREVDGTITQVGVDTPLPETGGDGLTNPMTTAEDVIKGGASGTPARLAKGSDGQVLTMVTGAVAWANASTGFSNPMTTSQDLIVGGASGAAARLAVGASGRVLRVVSGSVAWDTVANLLTDLGLGSIYQPLDSDLTAIAALSTTSFGRSLLALADAAALLTAAGGQASNANLTTISGLSPTNDDVMQRKAGAWANRTIAQLLTDLAAAGTTFQPLDSDLTAIAALTTTSTGRSLLAAADAAAIRVISGSFANPMTTSQDIIVGGASGAAGRLAKGADNQVLTVVSGSVAWANASSGFSNPMTTAGDIIVGGASGAAARLAAGSNGKFLTLSSGTPAWGDAQPLDATLTALAGVTVAADKLIYGTGADAFSTTDFSAFGRSLVDDADAAAARTTLGVTVLSAPADANFFPQRNSGNSADEYGRHYFSFVTAIPAANGTERLWQAPTNRGAVITGAHAWTDAGTVTLALKIGTTAITGLSALSVTSTEGTDTAGTAANVMAGDDKLNATQSSMSGAATLWIRVQGYLGRATA